MSNSNIPEARSYRHVKCNAVTTVSGQPFEVMSNPLSDMSRTWCVQCNAYFPLSDYEWLDTQENVAAYYARHSAKATDLQRFLCSRKCMIILAVAGLVLGSVGGFFLFRNDALWARILFISFCGGLGAFIGCAIYISGLCAPITRKVCGVDDTRTLV